MFFAEPAQNLDIVYFLDRAILIHRQAERILSQVKYTQHNNVRPSCNTYKILDGFRNSARRLSAYIVIQPKIFKTFINKVHFCQCDISSLSGLPLNFKITPADDIVLTAFNVMDIVQSGELDRRQAMLHPSTSDTDQATIQII